MPELFIDGRAIACDAGRTVIEVARANGIDIPHFCWHPSLSVAGNCRICMVEVEGRGLDIACNLPVTDGMRVLTSSPAVVERRREMLQLQLLNHPVDCGICDKAGECLLQDYHYEHNGRTSVSHEPKVQATKFHALSSRIVLDNERCVLCTRCVRFTHEVSKSHGLGVLNRGDHSLIRASEDGAFERDAYSDNVVDLCPVGALLSRTALYKARVWYLEPTRSVCPGCERGCSVDLWHRKREWKLNALDARQNRSVVRVTPPDAGDGGAWICNKGRDIAARFERPRATQALVDGHAADVAVALEAARRIVASAKRPVALVSSHASNEELDAFRAALGADFEVVVKADHVPAPGEVLADDLLIRADKNPNRAGALARFPTADDGAPLRADVDLVLVWGEGFDFARVPSRARVIVLGSYATDASARANVFVPVSIQTERAGSYTNFEGRVARFDACFERLPGTVDAADAFAAIAVRAEVAA